MTLPPRLIAPAAFAAAAVLAVLAAAWAALAIESRTGTEVQSLMTREGLSWVDVATDGLQVRLTGTAPTEALRFRAVNLTASLVEAGRIRANPVFGEHGLDLFLCGDQLLKGAALNAVQIAERLPALAVPA